MKRTDAPPQQPSPAPQPAACPNCQGAGGHTEDTSRDGVTRQNWRTCGTCRGAQ